MNRNITTVRATAKVAVTLRVTSAPHAEREGYFLKDQHRVAVAVKAVPLADRFIVGPADQIVAAECANEHEQRRAW